LQKRIWPCDRCHFWTGHRSQSQSQVGTHHMTVRSYDPESGQEYVRKGAPSISGNDHVASTWCKTESIIARSKHVGISREMGHSDRIRVRSPFKSSMGQNHENWLARQGQNLNSPCHCKAAPNCPSICESLIIQHQGLFPIQEVWEHLVLWFLLLVSADIFLMGDNMPCCSVTVLVDCGSTRASCGLRTQALGFYNLP
jgi:hypothetical protein